MESSTIRSAYRADIDGLRAVAVLLVVFNHLRFPHFEGGYVGVDVFFVISGYLIGASLLSEYRENRFSLGAFYERRVRRIAPALLAMLFVVTVLSYLYLTPISLMQYASSMLAALLSVSNILFWSQAGYFDAASGSKPLLHTWSLGVEEQFYVFFPLLLFFIFRRWPRHILRVLWAVFFASFVAAVLWVRRDPSAAFFWSPLRGWELLAGTLTSQYGLSFLRRRWWREAAAMAGLLLIVYAGFRFTASTPFPGWSAMLPCLGTAAILAAGQVGPNLIGALLSVRPVRFIGRISYSFYLWHWPLLVFQDRALLFMPRPSIEGPTKLVIFLVSLAVSIASWRWIEEPFRRKSAYRPGRSRLFLVTGAASLACAAVAGLFLLSNGSPHRFQNNILQVAAFEDYHPEAAWRTGKCFIVPPTPMRAFLPQECLAEQPGKRNYLLYGDSTAAQLYPGLVTAFPQIHFLQATAAGCLPVNAPQAWQNNGRFGSNCEALWNLIHKKYLNTHHPDTVILAGRWSADSLVGLGAEVDFFRRLGIRVVVVGPDLSFNLPLPTLLTSELQTHKPDDVRVRDLSRHLDRSFEVLDGQMQRDATTTWHVPYISYYKDLCQRQVEMQIQAQWRTQEGCPVFAGANTPLMFDDHHLTVPGSVLFATLVREHGELAL